MTVDFIAISKDGEGAHRHQVSNFNPLVTVHTTTNTTANDSIKSPFFSMYLLQMVIIHIRNCRSGNKRPKNIGECKDKYYNFRR